MLSFSKDKGTKFYQFPGGIERIEKSEHDDIYSYVHHSFF